MGIEATKEEKAIKNAYREKLATTNPEDDPESFKRLRGRRPAGMQGSRRMYRKRLRGTLRHRVYG